MKTPHDGTPLTRRRALLAAAMTPWLAACGGGSRDADADPAITEFSADRGGYFVGERARITVRYRGSSARIEPDIGAVADGAVVTTPVLAQSRRLRLVVESAGRPVATRDLDLAVRFRDRWQPVTAAPMTYHASVNAGDGSVVVIGGSRGLGVLSDAVDRFDPATRTLRRIGTLATGRSNHSALRLADGRILVAGGATSSADAPFAELVDERSGAVTNGGRMAQPRARHAATLLADGRVLVSGGANRNTAEIWDPATGQWRLLASRLAHDREYHSATLLADGRVLVAGGYSQAAGYVFAELFDPRSEIFTPLASGITQQRQLHAAHRLSDGSVALIGGEDPTAGGQPLTTVLRFMPAAAGGGAFFDQPRLVAVSTVAASLLLPEDRVMLIGGQTRDEVASGSAVMWHVTGEQRGLAPMLPGRVWATANRLPDGRVLVLGGDDGAGGYVPGGLIYE